ncbi:MAG: DUF6527 family protein [Negativicutes bacterium]|nr:DUF6527 family protein [Negativicutes bacterium]
MPRARVRPSNVMFNCPGCKEIHRVSIGPDGWKFIGDENMPTIIPSILVNKPGPYHIQSAPTCHSFVKGGRIQFLEDSTHELAGQTVDLPEWE